MVQLPDFTNARFIEGPGKNLLENVLKGYQMGKEPARMEQESKAKEQERRLKESMIGHYNALSQKALNPMTGTKVSGDYAAWDSSNPDASPEERKKAFKQIYDEKNASKGISFSSSPEGGIDVQIGGQKGATIPGLGKLPTGWTPVQNEEGKTIGANVPLDKNQVNQFVAKEKFNTVYPFINKSLSAYSGKGSYDKFLNDVENYSTDPDAKKRIDNFRASKKLATATGLTEVARLGGHSTNVQLEQIKDTLDSAEVHKMLEALSTTELPEGYAERAGEIFNDKLNDMESVGMEHVPLYQTRYINPKSKEAEQHKELSGSMAKEASSSLSKNTMTPLPVAKKDGITSFKLKGKIYNIPDRLVDKFLTEHTGT